MVENELNIHGREGCLTATGELCQACCRKKTEIKDVKPLGTVCQFCKNGCTLHATPNQPQICVDYHCSQDIQKLRDYTKNELHEGPALHKHYHLSELLEDALEHGETIKEEVDARMKYFTAILNS